MKSLKSITLIETKQCRYVVLHFFTQPQEIGIREYDREQQRTAYTARAKQMSIVKICPFVYQFIHCWSYPHHRKGAPPWINSRRWSTRIVYWISPTLAFLRRTLKLLIIYLYAYSILLRITEYLIKHYNFELHCLVSIFVDNNWLHLYELSNSRFS